MLVEITLSFGKTKRKIYQWKKVMRIARSRRRIRRDSLIFEMIGNEMVVIVVVLVAV